jgi:hypothetical protein
MKINEKMLYLPPYLSTTWSQVKALYDKNGTLIVTLADGDTVNVPGLSSEEIKQIFNMHAAYLEHATIPNINDQRFVAPFNFMPSKNEENPESPLKLAFGAFDSLGTAMQHNPAQSNAPNLPQEILNKIAAISKIVAPEEINSLPEAEPHCNCFHCQIARAIHKGLHPVEQIESEGEIVSDAELQFQEWEIKQMDDKIFQVINRLDNREQYQVYLGEPVGCTCGKQNCEHIVAVLKS